MTLADVPYSRLVADIASKVADILLERRDDPEYICQRQAFKIFGRANVERWRRTGQVVPCIRPKHVEYRTADLRRLQANIQDYL